MDPFHISLTVCKTLMLYLILIERKRKKERKIISNVCWAGGVMVVSQRNQFPLQGTLSYHWTLTIHLHSILKHTNSNHTVSNTNTFSNKAFYDHAPLSTHSVIVLLKLSLVVSQNNVHVVKAFPKREYGRFTLHYILMEALINNDRLQWKKQEKWTSPC